MHIDKVKERLSELARISEEGAKLHPEDSEMFITDKEALETALKHIERLQKENEELKNRNSILESCKYVDFFEIEKAKAAENKRWNDKIRKLIENETLNISKFKCIALEDVQKLLKED